MNSSFESLPKNPDAAARHLLQRAHNQDGLPEIAVGLFSFFVAGMNYGLAVLSPGTLPYKADALCQAIVIPFMGVVLCLPSTWAWIRRRFPAEKFGYVRREPMGKRKVGIQVALFLGVAVLALVTIPHLPKSGAWEHWLPALTGVFGGALAAFSGGSLRFVLGGLLMAGAGILVSFQGLPLEMGFAVFFGFVGVLALVSGAIVFSQFMRRVGEDDE
jgi:hypothetical protein